MTRLDDPAAPFREIYRNAHAGHASCQADEWLGSPCPGPNPMHAGRSLVWSRRNGPWRPVELLFVGSAPGNAGGRGSGPLGAHATRIPFGGDIAGANLDTLLASIGTDRNNVFIVAALNCLPVAGGGEPRLEELRQPVGAYPTSVHLLRDTILATVPRLIVCLGNIAVRVVAAAVDLAPGAAEPDPELRRLPSLAQVRRGGLERGIARPLEDIASPDHRFRETFARRRAATGLDPATLPSVLWLFHPSGQNMSPFAAEGTAFHRRMVETRDALRRAVSEHIGPLSRAPASDRSGIYALDEWTRLVGPHHDRLIALWHERGL